MPASCPAPTGLLALRGRGRAGFVPTRANPGIYEDLVRTFSRPGPRREIT